MDEQRIIDLESRVRALESEVAALRAAPAAAPRQVQVPPHIQPPPVQYVPPPLPPQPHPAPPLAQPVAAKPDTEYLIGAQIIPRVAALILLLGIGFLVSLGVNRGWITPVMLYSGAVGLCLAFIGIGQYKREEREEFGQILTGIGSCGLYLTFAAGHIFQKLYSGEVLVALFLGLSFLNLGYSLWRASRSFLAIGLIGGLAAAMMPLDKGNATLSLALHLLVVLPSAMIVARHRWADVAVGLWLAATLAILPAWLSHIDWPLRVGAAYLSTLLCVAAYGLANRKLAWDPQAVFAPFALGATALANFMMHAGRDGSAHILVFSVVVLLAGLALGRQRDARNLFVGSAIAIALILVPFGYELSTATYIFCALAVVCAALAAAKYPKALASLGAVELMLGIATYLLQFLSARPGAWAETGLLGALAVATIACAYGAIRTGQASQPMILGAAALLLPIFVRGVERWLVLPEVGAHLFFACSLGLLMFTVLTLGLVLKTQWTSAAEFLWGVLLLGLVSYCVAIVDDTGGVVVDMLVVIAFMLATAGAVVASVQAHTSGRGAMAAAAFILGGLFLRLGFLGLTSPSVGFSHAVAILVSASTFGLLTAAVARVMRWGPVLPAAWSFWAFSTWVYIQHALEVGMAGTKGQIGMVGLNLIALAVLAIVSLSHTTERKLVLGGSALAGWAVFTRLGFLLLTDSAVGMQQQPAITVAWIVYGLGLMILGFGYHHAVLRYTSFAVFGSAVAKVLLIDLASTDPAIRVVVLMALGLTLLGGGYWYIRNRQALT